MRHKSFHTAAGGETHEYQSMYPGFVAEAKSENEAHDFYLCPICQAKASVFKKID